jgi:hypothetical protein
MKKLTLDLDELQVSPFETGDAREDCAAAAITGLRCVTWPTVYGTCCTP